MADFTDAGAFAYLQGWVATFKKHYHPEIGDMLKRFGSTTKHMQTSKRVLNGSSMEIEVQAYHNRSTRATKDLMAAMPDPQPGAFLRYTVNMDHTSEADNDFANFEIGFRTTWWDMVKSADSNFKGAGDYVKRDVRNPIVKTMKTLNGLRSMSLLAASPSGVESMKDVIGSPVNGDAATVPKTDEQIAAEMDETFRLGATAATAHLQGLPASQG